MCWAVHLLSMGFTEWDNACAEFDSVVADRNML